MQTFKFNRYETNLFDLQHANLLYDQEMYLPFINRVMSKENILLQTKQKKISIEERVQLKEELLKQYEGIRLDKKVSNNLLSLEKLNTFTITTGHQLSLFTGPLYFVVKILHIVKQCEALNKEYPELNFVPVYWMASEDHDFEEIQEMNIFNKQIKWESTQQGPVGKFALDNEFARVKHEFLSLFGDNDSELVDLVNAYNGDNYGDAFRRFINCLFGKYGLIIIDGDSRVFKTKFKAIMREEITAHFSQRCVNETSETLKAEGGLLQIKAREVNLFYIENGIRERIAFQNDAYTINGVGDFTQNELLDKLENKPENFSPNVVLRPVFQELLLPNVMYVGGGGEISYWLQLKKVFEHVKIDYPLLQVRNSVIWIDEGTATKIEKFGLLLEDIFKHEDLIKREYVELHEGDTLDFTDFESRKVALMSELKDIILNTDLGLVQYAEAEIVKITKQIDQIQAKLVRISKSKHDTAMKSIEQIKSKLFPNNELQERKLNFFNFCHRGDVSHRLNMLYTAIEPFEKDLIVIRNIPNVK